MGRLWPVGRAQEELGCVDGANPDGRLRPGSSDYNNSASNIPSSGHMREYY